MKTHGKIAGWIASSILQSASKKLVLFYEHLLCYSNEIIMQAEWVAQLQKEADSLIGQIDPKKAVKPEVVEKITELMKKIDSIYSEFDNLRENFAELDERASLFYEVTDDWEYIITDDSCEEESPKSES